MGSEMCIRDRVSTVCTISTKSFSGRRGQSAFTMSGLTPSRPDSERWTSETTLQLIAVSEGSPEDQLHEARCIAEAGIDIASFTRALTSTSGNGATHDILPDGKTLQSIHIRMTAGENGPKRSFFHKYWEEHEAEVESRITEGEQQ